MIFTSGLREIFAMNPRFECCRHSRDILSATALQRRAPGLSRAEASELIGLVDRVERRLGPWWRAEGERLAKARIQGVIETARRNRMMQALGRMAQFLESVPPSRHAYVHAIAPPEPESKDYNATAILNHLPIEAVTAANDPNEIVEGAVHEIAHYLYDYIPPKKHLALVNEFAAAGAPSIAGIYSYLHEAMAVSAQGLYRDALDKGASDRDDDAGTGYKHPYIPLLAGAAAPLVKAAVARDEDPLIRKATIQRFPCQEMCRQIWRSRRHFD